MKRPLIIVTLLLLRRFKDHVLQAPPLPHVNVQRHLVLEDPFAVGTRIVSRSIIRSKSGYVLFLSKFIYGLYKGYQLFLFLTHCFTLQLRFKLVYFRKGFRSVNSVCQDRQFSSECRVVLKSVNTNWKNLLQMEEYNSSRLAVMYL
jgi:hypothetical protein